MVWHCQHHHVVPQCLHHTDEGLWELFQVYMQGQSQDLFAADKVYYILLFAYNSQIVGACFTVQRSVAAAEPFCSLGESSLAHATSNFVHSDNLIFFLH